MLLQTSPYKRIDFIQNKKKYFIYKVFFLKNIPKNNYQRDWFEILSRTTSFFCLVK